MSQAEEILDGIYNGVIDGDESLVSDLTRQALEEGLAADKVLYEALIPALEEVGALFRARGLFRA